MMIHTDTATTTGIGIGMEPIQIPHIIKIVLVSVSLSVPSRYYTSFQYHYLAGDHNDTNVDIDTGIQIPILILEIGGTLVERFQWVWTRQFSEGLDSFIWVWKGFSKSVRMDASWSEGISVGVEVFQWC